MSRYCIVVENTARRLTYAHFLQFPAQIGRSHAGTMHIVLHDLDPQNPTISRHHATIERRSGDRLVVVDRSSHGTLVDGRRCESAGELPIQVGSSIVRIEHYRLRIVKRPEFELVDIRDGVPPDRNERWPMVPGAAVAIGDINGQSMVLSGECLDMPNADEVLTIRVHLRAHGHSADWQGALVPPLKDVRLNDKLAPTTGWFPLRENDTLIVNRRRFAFIRYGRAPVQCGNDDCRLLTPPTFQPVCRFCQEPFDKRAVTVFGAIDDDLG